MSVSECYALAKAKCKYTWNGKVETYTEAFTSGSIRDSDNFYIVRVVYKM